MDTPQYSTLLDALQGVPDPRRARGKRYPWLLLLTQPVEKPSPGCKALQQCPTLGTFS